MISILTLTLLGATFLFTAALPAAPVDQTVAKRWWTDVIDLDYAVVQGFKQNGLNNYLGIRYASELVDECMKTLMI
jgi:hypothetical protein